MIAAGAWSHRLARRFGDVIPLETERGYNTTLPKSAFDVKRMLIFSGHGFVVTPLADGVRVGGAVELGGLERPPNFLRARAMLKRRRHFLPGLTPRAAANGWAFARRCPTRCRSSALREAPNVFYAFGHGHLGLTQAAATGRLSATSSWGKLRRSILQPFRAQRF